MSECGCGRAEIPSVVIASRKQLSQREADRRRKARLSRLESADDAERARRGNMLPPPERERHGVDVETDAAVATDAEIARAGIRVRRTQSPIERYASRDLLTRRQTDAADDLRTDWEFGIVGAKDGNRGGAGGGPAGFADSQIAAATAYREAVQAIGMRLADIVLPIVIGMADGGEITAGTLAKRRGDPNEQRVMGVLSVGLDSLADHYSLCGDKRRAAKYS